MTVSRISLQRNPNPAGQDTHVTVPDTSVTDVGVPDTQTVGDNPQTPVPEEAPVANVPDPGQRNPLALTISG